MRRTKIHDVTTKFANVTFPSIQVDANLYHIKLTSTQDSIVPVSIDLYSVYSHTTWYARLVCYPTHIFARRCDVQDFADHATPPAPSAIPP
ncbi:hypothetical protein DYB28_003839, partial [Aphanomyces astaci]